MGNKLFSRVTALTGLPQELIGQELTSLLERKGISPQEVTMQSLREALEEYLAEVAQEMGEVTTDEAAFAGAAAKIAGGLDRPQ